MQVFKATPLHTFETGAYLIQQQETTWGEYLSWLDSLPAGERAAHVPRAPDLELRRVGDTWELRRDGLKPYACGVVSHPTIDAVRHLRDVAQLAPDDIQEIHAEVNPYVLELMGKREPTVGLEGKFSIYHCAAIGYIDGTARVRQFTDAAVQRPDVVALRGRVRVETDHGLATNAARVRLVAKDGTNFEDHVEAATGTPANPMPDPEVVDKFVDLVGERMTPLDARRLAARALAVSELADVGELVAQLGGSGA